MMFILRSSKTHWIGSEPQLVKISSIKRTRNNRRNPYCPYRLLDEYSKKRGPYQGDMDPFFTFTDGSAIKPAQLRNCLRMLLTKAGFNASLYGSHSFRIGRSCDLLKLGLSVETIKKFGRWKSNTVFRYLSYYVK